ncbi:DUF5131 family protein [Paenibacillus hodogayensis]|uniref:DUF5131 family protein n=1 Tax=Paenibacillus hodogayensis TaxID=279208 RepID=A0ABV5W728_9BACL
MHTYQILTKRPERALEVSHKVQWTNNIWQGTSVENNRVTGRIDILREIPAKVRFISCEPLIGPLNDLNLLGIHWVIVGGESGPGSRKMEEQWVRDIQVQCAASEVAFFFKQWGGVHKHLTGRLLDGKEWSEFPV